MSTISRPRRPRDRGRRYPPAAADGGAGAMTPQLRLLTTHQRRFADCVRPRPRLDPVFESTRFFERGPARSPRLRAPTRCRSPVDAAGNNGTAAAFELQRLDTLGADGAPARSGARPAPQQRTGPSPTIRRSRSPRRGGGGPRGQYPRSGTPGAPAPRRSATRGRASDTVRSFRPTGRNVSAPPPSPSTLEHAGADAPCVALGARHRRLDSAASPTIRLSRSPRRGGGGHESRVLPRRGTTWSNSAPRSPPFCKGSEP